jgi:tagaturonate epimerase
MEARWEALCTRAAAELGNAQIYPESVTIAKGCILFLVKLAVSKKLVVMQMESDGSMDAFEGEKDWQINGTNIRLAPLSHSNAKVLRAWFPFTAPTPFGKEGLSLGLGDRLGLASGGHLRLIKNRRTVRPVLAQQSIRELSLTNRTYEDVLDAASWAVFQEGYRWGFGADGDHLKTAGEVKMALDIGYSMITLDCSEKIDNTIISKTAAEIAGQYRQQYTDETGKLEEYYLGKTFTAGDAAIRFSASDLQQNVLIYGKALAFTRYIYFDIVKVCGRMVDFEVSIDETMTPTSPQAHFFVASELAKMGVDVTSLAPRFCGEFQKGIDYSGDLAQFATEFQVHAQIADHFGYRLSIHSGSDKFSVFPVVGHYTKGRVHVKTAGTNWLEALKVISCKKPAVFRSIYAFALAHFGEATRYYHVTTDLSAVPDITGMEDSELATVFTQNDARQVLHITYGILLQARAGNGRTMFRDAIYEALHEYEDAYYEALIIHIGKHLAKLNEGK